LFLVFINWVVILLYSKQFIAVNTMIYWAALGMFLKQPVGRLPLYSWLKGPVKLFGTN